MVQFPHVFVSARTPHVLEFPRGLVLEPVISKTGFSLPVDRFRLSLPGRFNLVCIFAFAFVWRSYYSWLLPRTRNFPKYWYAECRSWYAVCTWYAEYRYAECRLWYAVCILYAEFFFSILRGYSPLNAEISFLRG